MFPEPLPEVGPVGRRNPKGAAVRVHLLSIPLALSGASAQPVPAEVQGLPGTESARALIATPEWCAFRAFWKTVEPPPEGEQYDWDLMSARRDTLTSLTRALRSAAGDSVVSSCAGLLGQLCDDRMSMAGYGLPEMLTRMIPSRAIFHEESALRRLEGRLDALSELSLDPLYDSSEMAGLLGSAVREATSALLFDAMSDNWVLPHTFPGLWDEESLSTSELLSLDLASLDSLARISVSTSNPAMKEACTLALGRVRSIQASLPALEVLLGDLLAPR